MKSLFLQLNGQPVIWQRLPLTPGTKNKSLQIGFVCMCVYGGTPTRFNQPVYNSALAFTFCLYRGWGLDKHESLGSSSACTWGRCAALEISRKNVVTFQNLYFQSISFPSFPPKLWFVYCLLQLLSLALSSRN